MNKDYTTELMEYAYTLGATLVGVADLNTLRSLNTQPPTLLKTFNYAVSIAISLPTSVFKLITKENPGELYAHYYKTANSLLDLINLQLSERIIQHGYNAIVIPASLSIGKDRLKSNVSHKALARAAGLGWIGKNILLITPKYGPRVRLATVLTDIPLRPGKPIEKQGCGECSKCIEACPVHALKPINFIDYPIKREEVFDAKKCHTRMVKISQMEFIGVSICGMCIKVCPIGKCHKNSK